MTKIDSKRIALVRDAGLARDALAEAALILENNPDDPSAQAAVVQLQNEVEGAERRITQYDLARVAAAREVARRASADTEAEVESLIARIADLNRAAVSRAGRIARAIETLGAEYATLITDLGEARALTGAAIRLRGGTAALTRLGTALDGHDVVAASIGPALAASGLGVVGPSLSPWVVVSPPSGAFQPVALGPALERLHERRLDAIERAATFGKQEAAA